MRYLEDEKVMEMMQWELDALPEYSGNDEENGCLNSPKEDGPQKWKRLQNGYEGEDDYWVIAKREPNGPVTWYLKIRVLPNKYKIVSDGTVHGTTVTSPGGEKLGFIADVAVRLDCQHSFVNAQITLVNVDLDIALLPEEVRVAKGVQAKKEEKALLTEEMCKSLNIPCGTKK